MATRAQIITRARRKADMESSPFIGSGAGSEELDLFNEAYAEVYSLMCMSGLHMLETDYTIPVDGSTTYTLPTDFFAVLHVLYSSGGEVLPLSRVQPDIETYVRSMTGNEANYYKIRATSTNGRTIQLYPNPDSGTYTLVYVPSCPSLTSDSDVVVERSNSNALLTALLAQKMLAKQGEVNSAVENELNRLYDEVRKESEAVEMTQQGRIQDTRYRTNQRWRDAFDYRLVRDDY